MQRREKGGGDSTQREKKNVMYLFVDVSLLERYLYVYMCISIQKHASLFVPLCVYVCLDSCVRLRKILLACLFVCWCTYVHFVRLHARL